MTFSFLQVRKEIVEVKQQQLDLAEDEYKHLKDKAGITGSYAAISSIGVGVNDTPTGSRYGSHNSCKLQDLNHIVHTLSSSYKADAFY